MFKKCKTGQTLWDSGCVLSSAQEERNAHVSTIRKRDRNKREECELL